MASDLAESVAGLPAKTVGRIWLRMTEIYGHKWTSSYDVSDRDGTWAKGLADMSNDELKAGFIACVTRGEAWPPSLPEFRALCRPPSPPKRENESMYRMPPSHQLTHQITPETRQYGRSMCAYLKQKVRAS